MSAITIRIVTPKSIAFEGKTDMVTGPSFDGIFGVLENHTRYLTLSEPGILYLVQNKSGPSFGIGQGFAEVADNVVTFLVDSCVSTDEVESLEEHINTLKEQ